MSENEPVKISPRYLRSIRIDTDLTESSNLDGFVFTQSYYQVLQEMIRHINETQQGAFTLTGPYGSGKSSLVIALCSLLSANRASQSKAEKIFGKDFSNEVKRALPFGSKGWRIVPVVGVRDNPITTIGEAARQFGVIKRRPRGGWTEKNLINSLMKATFHQPENYGGVVLFIDEMGKFLESSLKNGFDIYIFQQLAELASRSQGRLLIVGILHQAFEEYSHRLSHEARDEWAKIQGRFIDLIVSTTGEEQIELLAQAIITDRNPKGVEQISKKVSKLAFNNSETISKKLTECSPLHPIVSCLLGPISRRRFGQNQRSLFGFLNSAEPYGFQDFLQNSKSNELYTPDILWDYLHANLEPSILASPDGHRWALATEAIERCQAQGGEETQIRLLKIIAVMDLLKERSRIGPNFDLLKTCFQNLSAARLKAELSKLNRGSFTIYKKFNKFHAIYAGSDFDIERALNSAIDEINEIDFGKLKSLAGIQPIVAKRHFHKTGSLRWVDVEIVPLNSLDDIKCNFEPINCVVGKFILIIPTQGESEKKARELCQKAIKRFSTENILFGLSSLSWVIYSLIRELLALELVNETHSELAGDSVARREITSRIAELKSLLETEIYKSFDNALWYRGNLKPRKFSLPELNKLASELADICFNKSPIIHNELLNRHKPSTSAVAAQNNLFRRMITSESKQRLGINKFPAEAGLYDSIIQNAGLHRERKGRFCFITPKSISDPCHLKPLWDVAIRRIKKSTIEVSELYEIWRNPPFGVKEGLLPLLAISFILTQRDKLAVYREGLFKAYFDDVDVDYLTKDASSIQLRWMDISDISRRLLSELATIVRDLDTNSNLNHLEPIDVARGLVAIYDQLPQWTKRTMCISTNAAQIREMFKRARDPNKFLFDDIPEAFLLNPKKIDEQSLKKVSNNVRDGLNELVNAYSTMLIRIREVMLNELLVHNTSTQSLAELQLRAKNISQVAGDFKLEAFINRVSQFNNDLKSIEGIASLAASKPPNQWIDLDLDRTMVEIAELSQKFLRAETFARVKGRSDKRHAIAVVVGFEGKPTPFHDEFTIADTDRQEVDSLIQKFNTVFENGSEPSRNIILTALAELSAQYLNKTTEKLKLVDQKEEVA